MVLWYLNSVQNYNCSLKAFLVDGLLKVTFMYLIFEHASKSNIFHQMKWQGIYKYYTSFKISRTWCSYIFVRTGFVCHQRTLTLVMCLSLFWGLKKVGIDNDTAWLRLIQLIDIPITIQIYCRAISNFEFTISVS